MKFIFEDNFNLTRVHEYYEQSLAALLITLHKFNPAVDTAIHIVEEARPVLYSIAQVGGEKTFDNLTFADEAH